MAEKGSRYKTEVVAPTVAGSLIDGLIEIATFGAAKAQIEVKRTDTKTGETRTGYGESVHKASENAHSKFGKK